MIKKRKHETIKIITRAMLALVLLGAFSSWSVVPAKATNRIDIIGPAGSVSFGKSVAILPNGNIVVTDPDYDGGIGAEAGAAYLYNGASGEMISMLTGSHAGDEVGSGEIIALSNGNYVVSSPDWNNGGTADAGAVTWGSASTGVNGVVSAANSLVGSQANDSIGALVIALSNGNYLVVSPLWNNGSEATAGAVTWGDGTSGTVGVVSDDNSLVGRKAGDYVGSGSIVALANGNYVVGSPNWDGNVNSNIGAATWGNGTEGTVGEVSISNSLIGSHTDDNVGKTVYALSNGNYVAASPDFDAGGNEDAGAATWGNGTSGTTGTVSFSNSLVGSNAFDKVGHGVVPLTNGNYVVESYLWDRGAITDAGAVTWGNGSGGTTGEVSATNSLVGSQDYDLVGFEVTALTNGNYVVGSEKWDNVGITNAGAATWGNGSSGTTGSVTTSNSLVGSQDYDQVGINIVALVNGNYVVNSQHWDSGGAMDAGAAAWGNGSGGTNGEVSASNSLVGSKNDDRVGFGITPLSSGSYVVRSPNWDYGSAEDAGAATLGDKLGGTIGIVTAVNSLVGSQDDDSVGFSVIGLNNGNYVVVNPNWDNDLAANAGAVTWGDGNQGITGEVTKVNSLVGKKADDQVGYGGVKALTNGNYVVASPNWDSGIITDIGAITWGDGNAGIVGEVTKLNSLVGNTLNDEIGLIGVTALGNGDYVVDSPNWDNDSAADAGAISWGYGVGGLRGSIDEDNSVVGTAAGGGSVMNFKFDEANKKLVVGRPADNMVTIWWLPYVYLPVSKR